MQGAVTLIARNAVDPLLASARRGAATLALLSMAEVAPDAHSSGSIGAPRLRNLSHLQNLSTKTMTDASTVTNTVILLRNCPKAHKELVDDIVKELNAMNSWPDLDGPAANASDPSLSLN